MFELKRPLLISIFVIVIMCLMINIIKLNNSDFVVKQVSNYNFEEIICSLEILIIVSIIIGFNLYKYTFPSFDIETMIEHDKYLIDNQ
jgi:hypothetical protein